MTIPAENGRRKQVTEGDFLILVRRRSGIFTHLIRACKARGLNIAGADRLRLTDELAVKDLLALLNFLATPEDNLSLAVALRSPLFGWSEQQLFSLAAHRGGAYLWQALRADDTHCDAVSVLQDLLREADFLRPYELLNRILLRHGAREKLLARLGPESLDGIDELLVQALGYERGEIPSLTGFLAWLDSDEIEVKREAEGAGDKLRVMTVHGAKGLEAPIVILPDTMTQPSSGKDNIVATEDGRALWKMPEDERPQILSDIATRMKEADEAERSRLLYVAMTRAEKWLIICGYHGDRASKSNWHKDVEEGLERADPSSRDTIDTPVGPGLRLSTGDWSAGDIDDARLAVRTQVDMPAWFNIEIATPETSKGPVSPSNLPGSKTLPAETARDDALVQGTHVHVLLEHLPQIAPEKWAQTAERLIGPDFHAVLQEARAVLDDPSIQAILARPALCEVPITAPFGSRQLLGNIDRLVISDDQILVIDYKSNTVIPDAPESVPIGLLRQMGAYAIALKQIYPNAQVDTAILWTKGPTLMGLPDRLVTEALGDPSSLDGLVTGA